MIALLADANIQRHVAYLVAQMQGAAWRDYWDFLQLRHLTFSDVDLATADSDLVVWQRCQERQALLLTNNRNDDGPESLEATIRRCNTEQSLPVFTISDADSVLLSHDFRERVIDRLFRYLLDLDNLRGTGRLFLP